MGADLGQSAQVIHNDKDKHVSGTSLFPALSTDFPGVPHSARQVGSIILVL